MELFSIGHSNHGIDTFISLLQKHGVTAVADVRSQPYSRFTPHFNRASLKGLLLKEGIQYVFLGEELGARPNNQSCYIDGKAIYELIAATDAFRKGIERIQNGLKKYRISLMCAEQDPLTCHRALLVCQNLRYLNVPINHILKNGDLESHQDLEDRMLNKHGFNEFVEAQVLQLSLFSENILTRAECLERAYRLQGDKIAYVEKEHNEQEQSDHVIHHRFHPKERTEIL